MGGLENNIPIKENEIKYNYQNGSEISITQIIVGSEITPFLQVKENGKTIGFIAISKIIETIEKEK